jgi:O-antigen ligase
VLALVVIAAACMVLLTGTRTALVTLFILAVLAILSGAWQPLARPRALGLGLAALGGLVLLSTLLGDTLWARLVELDRADYSSGRWPSIGHWLALSGGAPFGLGMGTIRATLAAGRPLIGDGQPLEWPHNELVRFYVEAGVPGVVLVLLLLGEVTRLAFRRARLTGDPAERALVLVIAADLWAQCLFQNYFNGVYQATVLMLLVGVLAAGGAAGRVPRPPATAPAGAAGWPTMRPTA